ncbi:hypothetical protein B0H11DRAFT_2243992 [Mycena galericulata]|nr:hypothetical protein B0H11DRAFT_2243992 [Mycena galericulata]
MHADHQTGVQALSAWAAFYPSRIIGALMRTQLEVNPATYDRRRKPHRARHHVTGIFHQQFQAQLQKAQRLLKQRWAKVLGVAQTSGRSRSQHTAKSVHPDKGGTEQKMVMLNEAYEVLSNPVHII